MEAVKKQVTGTSRIGEGLGAVFLLKCHQKEGLRVRMMLSWTIPDRDRKMMAASCECVSVYVCVCVSVCVCAGCESFQAALCGIALQ